ncbi:hypothetical protein [Viridibacillus arvi]|uniref:hypothetical protein n=1 Tax=Viridibacillus arvi TaxID=263475 RepID=UPI0034CDE5C8
MTREEVANLVGEHALFADGLDDAIIGCAQRGALTVALYDANKCIEILMRDEEMTYEDASEYFDYNILGAWVGEMTPAFAWLGEEIK